MSVLIGAARAVQAQWVRIFVVFAVFLILALNAVGAFNLVLDIGGGALTFPAVTRNAEFTVLLIVGLALSILLPVLNPIGASLVTLAAMVPIFYLGYQVQSTRPLVPMEYSLLTILMLFVVNVLISYFGETRKKQKLVQVFSQYVPPELAREISRDPEHFNMEGEAREMSVLFCDVHGFTAISERLDPRELARLLNTLLSPVTRIVYRNKGVIDKYMGDAVMAFWGAPVHDPHHAANAVNAAFEIQSALTDLRAEFRARGWPEIHMGIGINTGVMNVGNMGSEYRVAYTVIGDAVNLAARLQELTRVYRARIVVGEATRHAFPAVSYRELGLVQVKGKLEFARIFEPCDPDADPASTIVANMHRHNEALRAYHARQWDTAERLFEQLGKEHPGDSLYDYYLGRIAEFKVDPPPADWRGEIRYTLN